MAEKVPTTPVRITGHPRPAGARPHGRMLVMNHNRFHALSATFIAIALSAGCTAGTDEYPQEALGSSIAGLEEEAHLSAQQIQTVVRAEFPQYQACYEGLLA